MKKSWKKLLKDEVETNVDFSDHCNDLKKAANIKNTNPYPTKSYANPWKLGGRAIGVLAGLAATAFIITPLIVFTLSNLETKYEFHYTSHKFSLTEAKQINEETYKMVNSVSYPNDDKLVEVSDAYKEALNQFAYKVYQAQESGDNFFYSPLSLYLHLDLLSRGVSDSSLSSSIDSLMGLDEANRKKDFNGAFLSNRYKGSDTYGSHCEMDNGFFMDNDWTYSSSYLEELTSSYCEAFYLDLSKSSDVSKMLEWANGKVSSTSIDANDLELTDDTTFYLLSTLEFFGNWSFDASKTTSKMFYPKDGEPYSTKFMNKSFFGQVYEYDDYYSFMILFGGGYSLQLLTSRERGADVFEMASKRNFLEEDQSKFWLPENSYMDDGCYIYVSLPKFSASNSFSYNDALSKLGLSALYSKSSNCLSDIYEENTSNSCLGFTKQKNSIKWDETGTTASTITFSKGMDGAAAKVSDGIEFTLDSPFLYVIRDRNNLPLYCGRVDRP